MENQKTDVNKIREQIAETLAIPEFDPSLVSRDIVEKQLLVHQTAYLETCVTIKAEMKFLNDSLNFIEEAEKTDAVGLETARKHLEKAAGNPKYFQETKVDPSCHKSLGHLRNIESKIGEVKTQLWTIKYHTDKIAEVRGLLEQVK